MSPLRCASACSGLTHEHQIELLRALGAVFQHRAHRGVAVDIRVFTLDVRIHGGFAGDVVVNAHQARIHFANARALRAIENVRFRRVRKAVFNQHALDDILHLFHARRAIGILRIQFGDDLRCQRVAKFTGLVNIARAKCAQNRIGNLFGIECNLPTVALDDLVRHRTTSCCLNSLYPLYCA